MAITIKDRISSYEEVANYKFLPKLPVIIQINGRSFSKVTSLLDKPFCEKFSNCISTTMLNVCLEVEGAVFAYHFNDEITIILRNDQNADTIPWFDNKIQKIVSICSSIATLNFSNLSNSMDLNLMGDSVFTCSAYTAPSILEAIHILVSKQHQNLQSAIQSACFYELLKKYDKNTIKEMLTGLSIDDKVGLLFQECDIDFNNYPMAFKRGIACYRAPKVINDVVKNKWVLNKDLPIFTQDHSFLVNILKNGQDILRS